MVGVGRKRGQANGCIYLAQVQRHCRVSNKSSGADRPALLRTLTVVSQAIVRSMIFIVFTALADNADATRCHIILWTSPLQSPG